MSRVTLKKLAQNLGLSRAQTLKYVRQVAPKLGIQPLKMRTPDSGANPALTFTTEEADRIVEERARYFPMLGTTPTEAEGASGLFYVIQLVPDLDPRRIKLGFATDVRQRLGQHHTAAPTAKCVKSWPCRKAWEQAAIDCLTIGMCRLIRNEVFDCDDLGALLRKADALFNLMPDPTSSVELTARDGQA